MKKVLSLLVLAAMVFTSTGCATSTKVSFYTNDVEGASVYVDGKKIGETPILKYRMKNTPLHDEKVIIEKEGYQQLVTTLQKEVKWANAIGGYFFIIPLLWCYGPEPVQYYKLDKIPVNE